MSRAHLNHAHLSRANLRRAHFRDAYLSRTQFSGFCSAAYINYCIIMHLCNGYLCICNLCMEACSYRVDRCVNWLCGAEGSVNVWGIAVLSALQVYRITAGRGIKGSLRNCLSVNLSYCNLCDAQLLTAALKYSWRNCQHMKLVGDVDSAFYTYINTQMCE